MTENIIKYVVNFLALASFFSLIVNYLSSEHFKCILQIICIYFKLDIILKIELKNTKLILKKLS